MSGLTIDRRMLLKSSALIGLTSVLGASAVFAQSVDNDALLEAGPLEDMVLGDPNAPVTLVEYASMTCGHCANFHKRGFKHLKTEYIDQGKVFFVFREFPFDPLAAAAFMLARDAPGGKYFEMIDLLFETQGDWTRTDDPVSALFTIAQQAGYTRKSFEETLRNQELLDGINWIRNRGQTEFGVSSTPTFFVNGNRESGDKTKSQLDEILAAYL